MPYRATLAGSLLLTPTLQRFTAGVNSNAPKKPPTRARVTGHVLGPAAMPRRSSQKDPQASRCNERATGIEFEILEEVQ